MREARVGFICGSKVLPSIKGWLVAAHVAERKGNSYLLTDFGKRVLDNDNKVGKAGSWWAVHLNVCFSARCEPYCSFFAVLGDRAALIDGTLGIYTNRLMIERTSGWDLKAPDEADEPAGEVLRLIRDRLLDRRKKIHDLAELRKELARAPYGLPFSVMPIFTAVAIHKNHARLKWVNKTGDFASLLWNAFLPNSDGFKLRFDTFTPKQREVLEVLRQALGMAESEATLDVDERAREAVKEVRAYHNKLPDALKRSTKLSDEAKRLFDLLKRPGQDDQEVAKLLCDLVESDSQEQQRDRLRGIFDAIDRVANERRAEVRQVIHRFSRDPEQWGCIQETLRGQDQEALAVAITRVQANQEDGLDRVATCLHGKPFSACSDVDVGKLCGELKVILETASQRSVALPSDSVLGGGYSVHEPEDPEATQVTGTSADAFRSELTRLLARYAPNWVATSSTRSSRVSSRRSRKRRVETPGSKAATTSEHCANVTPTTWRTTTIFSS